MFCCFGGKSGVLQGLVLFGLGFLLFVGVCFGVLLGGMVFFGGFFVWFSLFWSVLWFCVFCGGLLACRICLFGGFCLDWFGFCLVVCFGGCFWFFLACFVLLFLFIEEMHFSFRRKEASCILLHPQRKFTNLNDTTYSAITVSHFKVYYNF